MEVKGKKKRLVVELLETGQDPRIIFFKVVNYCSSRERVLELRNWEHYPIISHVRGSRKDQSS